jgi:hypothetical protein
MKEACHLNLNLQVMLMCVSHYAHGGTNSVEKQPDCNSAWNCSYPTTWDSEVAYYRSHADSTDADLSGRMSCCAESPTPRRQHHSQNAGLAAAAAAELADSWPKAELEAAEPTGRLKLLQIMCCSVASNASDLTLIQTSCTRIKIPQPVAAIVY